MYGFPTRPVPYKVPESEECDLNFVQMDPMFYLHKARHFCSKNLPSVKDALKNELHVKSYLDPEEEPTDEAKKEEEEAEEAKRDLTMNRLNTFMFPVNY